MADSKLQAINTRMAELRASHADRVDPVRFTYLEGLCARLNTPHYTNNENLLSIVNSALAKYERDAQVQTEEAEVGARAMMADFPDYSDEVAGLLDGKKVTQLKELNTRLRMTGARMQARSPLTDLVVAFEASSAVNQGEEPAPSLDDLLTQHEREERGQNDIDNPDKPPNDAGELGGDQPMPFHHAPSQPVPLQSMAYFRESTKYARVDGVLERAINKLPENPGPHNPQMLAIRALKTMQDRSPQYARRFARYVETLVWLDRNSSKLVDGP